jgi:hypothetical protein
MKLQEQIKEVIHMIPEDHEDYESMKLTLSMACGVLDDGYPNPSDDDAEFKSKIISEASDILEHFCITANQPIKEAPRAASCGVSYRDSIDYTTNSRHDQPMRVIHEHRTQNTHELTSWMAWVIVPFVVSFLLVFAAALVR